MFRKVKFCRHRYRTVIFTTALDASTSIDGSATLQGPPIPYFKRSSNDWSNFDSLWSKRAKGQGSLFVTTAQDRAFHLDDISRVTGMRTPPNSR